MLESFLAKLGASTKITVGVSISPTVGLEMIEIDRQTGIVKKYSNRPLEYDYAAREIKDLSKFQLMLEELFEELRIPKRSNILLSIPNVHFGIITLPLLLADDSVTNAIISEVEQSYIFKRNDPVVGWSEVYSNIDTENRTLVYTAMQKTFLDGIMEACKDIGCTVVGVENSFTSLLRAMSYTEVAQDQMQENITWNLMVIGQNSYSIISMVGLKIMDYYEEPLALKSFVDDEIYNAITASAQVTLTGLYANYLYIVSETDLVSAEVLAMKLNVEGTVKFLECNKYVQSEFVPTSLDILPNMSAKITPEVVGTAVTPFYESPLKLNLIKSEEELLGAVGAAPVPKINIGGLEVELTPSFVKRMALILAAILLLPILILFIALHNFILPKERTALETITQKVDQVNSSLSQYATNAQNNTFNLNTTMSQVSAGNKTQILYYMSLGVSVPNKLWITYYKSLEGGKVDIVGKSSNVESIYSFYKSIKQMVNNSDVKLYKLEVTADSIDDMIHGSFSPKYYEFEITNMTEAELNPPAPSADNKDQKGGNTPASTNTSQAQFGFQLNKPAFAPSPTAPAAPNATASPNPQNGPAAQGPPGMPNAPGSPGALRGSAPVPGQPNPAAQNTPQKPGGVNLPKNLQKIEKF